MSSFIESGFTTRVEYEKWLAANPGAASAGKPTMVIRGMAISHNVIPAVLLAMDKDCGTFEVMNIMTGEHMTPAMLEVRRLSLMAHFLCCTAMMDDLL